MKVSEQHFGGWVWLINSYHLLLLIYALLRVTMATKLWWVAALDNFALYYFLPLILTVPILIVLRGRNSAIMGSLLLLVGIIWFRPPLHTSQIATDTLRVVTYNTLYSNSQLEDDARWLLTQEADVIILQEISAEADEPRLAPLRRYYPSYAYISGSVRIFSKYPIIDNDIILLQNDINRNARRYALRSQLDVNGEPITVYSVHLSLPINRDEARFPIGLNVPVLGILAHYDETNRNTQIRNLVADATAQDTPVIIAGDFNTSHTSAAHGILTQAGLRDAFAGAGNGFGFTFPATNTIPPLIRIDYIWHSRDLKAVSAMRGMQGGSDHYPLVVDFEMP